ncbi:MAG: hypothetical protein WA865_15865 [Spirulinaceae cyanobacterium]
MKLLFICSKNRWRSPTAEEVFSNYEGIESISAGTNSDSETPISGDLIEWADVVFVMENTHKEKITKRFNTLLKDKRIVVLGIADKYKYMQPELVELLEKKVAKSIELA